jgi:hypothetical protein
MIIIGGFIGSNGSTGLKRAEESSTACVSLPLRPCCHERKPNGDFLGGKIVELIPEFITN